MVQIQAHSYNLSEALKLVPPASGVRRRQHGFNDGLEKSWLGLCPETGWSDVTS